MNAEKKVAAGVTPAEKPETRDVAKRQTIIGKPSDAKRNDTGKDVDIKELMKKEMFWSLSASGDDHFEKSRPAPGGIIGMIDHPIYLDSYDKLDDSDPSRGFYTWSLAIQGVNGDRVIGARDKIENVIEMQVANFNIGMLPMYPYEPVSDSNNPPIPILTPNAAPPAVTSLNYGPLGQLQYNARLAIAIREINRQAVPIRGKGGREHFEFQTSDLPAAEIFVFTMEEGETIFLYPIQGFEMYTFENPIQAIQTISLQFLNPELPLMMGQDTYRDVTLQVDAGGSGMLQIVVPDMTVFQFSGTQFPALDQDDRVYLENVTTTNVVLNRYLNRPQGLTVGPTAQITTTSLRLNPDVDVSAFGAAGTVISSTTTVVFRIAKFRVRIPVRFRGVVNRLTQYMSP